MSLLLELHAQRSAAGCKITIVRSTPVSWSFSFNLFSDYHQMSLTGMSNGSSLTQASCRNILWDKKRRGSCLPCLYQVVTPLLASLKCDTELDGPRLLVLQLGHCILWPMMEVTESTHTQLAKYVLIKGPNITREGYIKLYRAMYHSSITTYVK